MCTTDGKIFAIFSCSKIVTAIAIMHLVENGGLDLDAPVGQWVPALANPEIIVDSTETDVTTRKAKWGKSLRPNSMLTSRVPITTRMLLSHTAGFSYSWYNAHLRRWYEQNNLAVRKQIQNNGRLLIAAWSCGECGEWITMTERISLTASRSSTSREASSTTE
jgi:CubicO group peptidase (beta-lactamase class C family)